jgi:hypothetical protein
METVKLAMLRKNADTHTNRVIAAIIGNSGRWCPRRLKSLRMVLSLSGRAGNDLRMQKYAAPYARHDLHGTGKGNQARHVLRLPIYGNDEGCRVRWLRTQSARCR